MIAAVAALIGCRAGSGGAQAEGRPGAALGAGTSGLAGKRSSGRQPDAHPPPEVRIVGDAC